MGGCMYVFVCILCVFASFIIALYVYVNHVASTSPFFPTNRKRKHVVNVFISIFGKLPEHIPIAHFWVHHNKTGKATFAELFPIIGTGPFPSFAHNFTHKVLPFSFFRA